MYLSSSIPNFSIRIMKDHHMKEVKLSLSVDGINECWNVKKPSMKEFVFYCMLLFLKHKKRLVYEHV